MNPDVAVNPGQERVLRWFITATVTAAMAIESVGFGCALAMGPRAWIGARS